MSVVNQHLDTCIYTPLPVLPASSISRTVPLETLKKMAEEEERRRHAPSFQQAFKDRYAAEARGERTPESLAADIIDVMQRDVLELHGFSRDDELALYELRTAAMQYPDEPVFQQSTFIKYNRCGDSAINNGDRIVDTPLFDPNTLTETSLAALVMHLAPADKQHLLQGRREPGSAIPAPTLSAEHQKTPLVIVTGSYT